jgi:hypothetical protein
LRGDDVSETDGEQSTYSKVKDYIKKNLM